MFLGDNLIETGVSQLVNQFVERKPAALLLLKELPDPRLFGVVELDSQGRIIGLEEKPKQPRSNLALVGVYLFSARVHQVISQLKPSWRGELEITDAISGLLTMNLVVEHHLLEGWWLDTGKKDDLLEANRLVLDSFLKQDVQGEVDGESRIVGRVEIRPGAKIQGSQLRGPVSIAENCLIKDSFIGPFTSVAAGSVIENSSLEHSVVLEDCHIASIERLADSLIGRGVKLSRTRDRFGMVRLFLGDNAQVEL
jgi:glucose-1-phosphate thymidylyltransferase